MVWPGVKGRKSGFEQGGWSAGRWGNYKYIAAAPTPPGFRALSLTAFYRDRVCRPYWAGEYKGGYVVGACGYAGPKGG